MRSSILLLMASALPLAAQLGGPTSGYVFAAETRDLRAMRGMAGMAHLGDALVKDADNASVSVDGKLAAVARKGAVELIRDFDTDGPVRVALAQETGDVLFAWSGQDLAAVFPASRKAMVWRKAGAEMTAVSIAGIDGEIRNALLDGENLVIAADGGLYLSRAGKTSRIQALAEPAALVRAGKDLYIADRGASQVLQIRDYAGEAAADTFAAVGQPVGLQLAGGNLLVASAQTRTVDTFDVQSRNRTGSLELDFLPTRMEALGGRPLALLNQGSADEPLYVLDAKDALRVYFVPAGRNQ